MYVKHFTCFGLSTIFRYCTFTITESEVKLVVNTRYLIKSAFNLCTKKLELTEINTIYQRYANETTQVNTVFHRAPFKFKRL